METKGFFQFESIIHVLISSCRFIWIPMLLVYSYYKYYYKSFCVGIMTSKVGPRVELVNE